jgi:hypothetical protein
MSYQQRVLRDNPVGFWALDSISPTTDSSPGIFSLGSRVLNDLSLGDGAVTSGISPLVCGGTAAASLTGISSSNISILNKYNMFYRGDESKAFTIEFWFSLENANTNNGMYKIPLLSNANTFSLYLLDNILTLEIPDSSDSINKFLYLEIEDLDPQIYVSISYSEKTYTISVNGNNSISLQMSNKYKFANTSNSSIVFSCYGESSNNKIIIDSIAFYNYELSLTQKLDHMVWGLSAKNAQSWTLANGGGYLEPKDEHATIENHTMFYSDETWSKGQFKNCYVNAGTLSVKYIPSFIKYSPSNIASVSLDGTNGLQTITDSSLYIENFDRYCNLNSDYLMLDVKGTAECAFMSIDGFEFGKLILRYNSSNKIELYSPQDNSIKLETASTISGFKTVKINITNNGSTLNMLVGTEQLSCSIPKGSLSKSLNIYLGNSYITNSSGGIDVKPIAGGLKNFKILYSDGTWAKAELLSNYNIAQYSEWVGQVMPVSSSNIVGSRIHYGSASHNISYFVSLQNSSNDNDWIQVSENAQQIPLITLNAPQPLFYTKIKINTPDSSINRPNVNFLEFCTYRSLFMNSSGFSFNLTPNISNNSYSYNYRPNEFNVLSRDTNLGIYFVGNGNAIITPLSNYKVVEFWFKIHSDPVDSGSYYIADITSSTNASLYYDQDMKLNLVGDGWTSGYLNGVEISGTPTLIVDEIYHFVGVLSTEISNAINLNAKKDNTNTGNTSIGIMSLYPTNPFSTGDMSPLAQYNRYLGINPYSKSDSQTFNINESVNIYSTNWATIPAAVV